MRMAGVEVFEIILGSCHHSFYSFIDARVSIFQDRSHMRMLFIILITFYIILLSVEYYHMSTLSFSHHHPH